MQSRGRRSTSCQLVFPDDDAVNKVSRGTADDDVFAAGSFTCAAAQSKQSKQIYTGQLLALAFAGTRAQAKHKKQFYQHHSTAQRMCERLH